MLKARLGLHHRLILVVHSAMEESTSQLAWQTVVEVRHCCIRDSLPVVLAARSRCCRAVTAASSARPVYSAHTERCARSVSEPRLRTRAAWGVEEVECRWAFAGRKGLKAECLEDTMPAVSAMLMCVFRRLQAIPEHPGRSRQALHRMCQGCSQERTVAGPADSIAAVAGTAALEAAAAL